MRKKGFTLIELLAVIVILAIIALIAVPIVINIINDAKEESVKRSIRSYIGSVTNAIAKENLKVKFNPDECQIQETGDLVCSENQSELITSDGTNILKIEMKGEKPSAGLLIIQNGKIVNITDVYINNKLYKYDENNNIVLSTLPEKPGLYSKSYKLLATWEELEDTYGFDIEKDADPDERAAGFLYDSFNELISSNSNLSSGSILIIKEGITKIANSMFYEFKFRFFTIF